MYKEDEARAVLQDVETIGIGLWQQKTDIYYKIQELVPKLGKIYENLIALTQKYQLTEINIEKKLEELKKIVNGLEKKDIVLLADTFNYEVYQTINVYLEIIKVENEEVYGEISEEC